MGASRAADHHGPIAAEAFEMIEEDATGYATFLHGMVAWRISP
jgi:hypothetical protein